MENNIRAIFDIRLAIFLAKRRHPTILRRDLTGGTSTSPPQGVLAESCNRTVLRPNRGHATACAILARFTAEGDAGGTTFSIAEGWPSG
jgi:hypothetical protein